MSDCHAYFSFDSQSLRSFLAWLFGATSTSSWFLFLLFPNVKSSDCHHAYFSFASRSWEKTSAKACTFLSSVNRYVIRSILQSQGFIASLGGVWIFSLVAKAVRHYYINSFLAHIAQTIFASMFPFYSYATETLTSTLNKTNSPPCFSPSFFFNRKNEISIPTIYINE